MVFNRGRDLVRSALGYGMRYDLSTKPLVAMYLWTLGVEAARNLLVFKLDFCTFRCEKIMQGRLFPDSDSSNFKGTLDDGSPIAHRVLYYVADSPTDHPLCDLFFSL